MQNHPATGPVVVITGAARGIGRTTAGVLAAEGYSVVIADVSEQRDTAWQVRNWGADVLEFIGDLADEANVNKLASQVVERFGRVDALVNNAGISLLSPAEHTSAADWRRVLDVNLTAPFLLCQVFGRMMLEAKEGSIVNVASVAGLRGVADRAAYNASKHGLVGLTKTLAAEWGGRGVRVNAVCPGWVKTEMDAADQASGGYTDDDLVNQVPMARFATPQDIAEAISFLLQPRLSGFINGVALPVDGGWTADGSWTSLRLSKRG